MSRRERNSSEKSDTSAEAETNLDLYESTARYYDLQQSDFPQDTDFYLEMAERMAGPILVCMCGTGRILIPLAEAGFEVVGVDRSPAMLDECARKVDLLDPLVQSRIEIIQDDVREVSLDREFVLAIVPFNSFLHLIETSDQVNALNNIHSHLNENGLIVISVFNPDPTTPNNVVKHGGTILTDGGEILSRFESRTFDRESQTTTTHSFYDISRQDRSLRRVTVEYTLRYVFHQEMVALLERTGFDVLEVYGDYEFTPFNEDDPVMVFIARRL
jgi:SAM-dependent methyltransferase